MRTPFLTYYQADGAGGGGSTGSTGSAPDGQGNNQGQDAGQQQQQTPGTQPGNTGDQKGGQQQQGRTFTQADVDRIVQERLREADARRQAKFEKDLADALAAKDTQVEKLVQERVEQALAQRALEATRVALKSRYGLSDDQVARLRGDTPDALEQDAATIYGPLLKDRPPVVPTGGQAPAAPAGGFPDLSTMTPEEIRQKEAELWAKLGG